MQKKLMRTALFSSLVLAGLTFAGLLNSRPMSKAAYADTNLVLNPSFEIAGSGGSKDAANWKEGTSHTRSTSKFVSGSWGLRSTLRSGFTSTRTAAPISVTPNTTYTLSGYIWKSATNSSSGSCIDMNDLQGEVQLCANLRGVWQFKSGTWNSGSNTSVTLRLVTDNSPNADSWFEDLALTPVGEAPPSSNVVQNSSFETAGTGGDTDAASWTEGLNHTRANDKFNMGSWSLKSTFMGAGDAFTQQTISVAPDTNYLYSLYFWKNATNAGSGTCADMNDSGGEVQLCASITGAWQLKSAVWNSGANTSVTLRLITDGSPNASSWFDDISLAPQAAPAPSPTPAPSATPTEPPTPCPDCPTTFTIAGAGDIACGAGSSGASCMEQETSDLLLNLNPDVVLTFGDTQYESGTLSDFNQSFDPSWGRLKAKLRPAPGNHEYLTSGASGYFDYFNGPGNPSGPAGDRDKGYYSYDLGNWHLIAANSNCSAVGGCGVGSPQYTWLQNDLAQDSHPCSVIYMHHPFASSDTRNFDTNPAYQPLLQLFYDDGGELLMVGHSHFYERFARMDANKQADPDYGFREIVAGTGGRNVYGFGSIRPLSEARNGASFGVIQLTLAADQYTWTFVPVPGQTFTDSGTENCHGPKN